MTAPKDMTLEQFTNLTRALIRIAWKELCLENVVDYSIQIIVDQSNSEPASVYTSKEHHYVTIRIDRDWQKSFDIFKENIAHELGHCVTYQYRQIELNTEAIVSHEFRLIHEGFAFRFGKFLMEQGLMDKWMKQAIKDVKNAVKSA